MSRISLRASPVFQASPPANFRDYMRTKWNTHNRLYVFAYLRDYVDVNNSSELRRWFLRSKSASLYPIGVSSN